MMLKLIADPKPYTHDELVDQIHALIKLFQSNSPTKSDLLEIPQSLVQFKCRENDFSGLRENANILHIFARLGGNFRFYPRISFADFQSLINFFVSHGTDINAQDIIGITPLMLAASNLNRDRADVMRPFLENHANPNAVAHNATTALYYTLAFVPEGADAEQICEKSALLLIQYHAEITPKITADFANNPLLHTIQETQQHHQLTTRVKALEEEVTTLKKQLAAVLDSVAKRDNPNPASDDDPAASASRYRTFFV